MKNQFFLGSLWGLIFVVGCSSGNCRQNRKADDPRTLDAGKTSEQAQDTAKDHVRVYKPDGSLQCNQGKKISLEAMKKDLKTIQVLSMSRKSDGFMRTQVCGQETGFANVYEIRQKDLADALKAGFSEWTYN